MNRYMFLWAILILICGLSAQVPEWQWANRAGGSNYTVSTSIDVDSSGDPIVCGYYFNEATFGADTLITNDNYDGFVAKLNSTGDWLWATGNTGYGEVIPTSVTVDANDNIYVTGYFTNTVQFGTVTLNGLGMEDIFVAKLDSEGNWLWAVHAGGIDDDYSSSIATDNNGYIYITGIFQNQAAFGDSTLTGDMQGDVFIAKLDPDGNWLRSVSISGTNEESGQSLAVDNAGSIYIAGGYHDTITIGTETFTSNTDGDMFCAKLDTDNNWVWANSFGNTDPYSGVEIQIDQVGNSYLTGRFQNTAEFGTTSLTSNGFIDLFVAKFDSSGDLLWARNAGGTSADAGYDLCVDNQGNIIITGYISNQVIFGDTSLQSSGQQDILVAKIDTNGNWLWALRGGGVESDAGRGITIDEQNHLYVCGTFENSILLGETELVCNGTFDAFVAMMSTNTIVDDPIVPLTSNKLLNPYPNPFHSQTRIEYQTKVAGPLNIKIYNLKGQLVRLMSITDNKPGQHSLVWDGTDQQGKQVSPGLYLVSLKAGHDVQTGKMLKLE